MLQPEATELMADNSDNHRDSLLFMEAHLRTLVRSRCWRIGFPCQELLACFSGRPRWRYVMRLRGDSEIHGTAAPLGCHVSRLPLSHGECRGLRNIRIWADGGQQANVLITHPKGLPVNEPWYLISHADPRMNLLCSCERGPCREPLFRDQKSGIFQLESSGLRKPERIDRLLRIVAIAVLAGRLQGYASSLAAQRRRVDPHWKRDMSFLRIRIASLQALVAETRARLMAWLPIPVADLELCIPSGGAGSKQEQQQLWFSRVDLPPRSAALMRRN